jgi:hypothetical protein
MKGILVRSTALCAHRVIHFARAIGICASSRLAGAAAGLATAGLVLEALLSIEFLFTGGENEFRAAVFADQSLVLVHV